MKQKKLKRLKRPCEVKSKELSEQVQGVLDKKFYQSLVDNPEIAEVCT